MAPARPAAVASDRARSWARSGTNWPCRYKTLPDAHSSPDSSIAGAYSPRWNRAAQTGPAVRWWHRRSSQSDTAFRRGPPARRARWCPIAPARLDSFAACAMGESSPSSACEGAIVRLRSSPAARLPARSAACAFWPGTRWRRSVRNPGTPWK